MNIKEVVTKNKLERLMYQGCFGIEKEGLRTDKNQCLALTDHPKVLGDRGYHPYIQTDFSEAQVELVTPPLPSINETFKWLTALQDVIHRSMDEEEYIWPFSMPNTLPEEKDIPIIRVSEKKEVQYREKLAEKYGKKKQMISGVHFNFAFSEAFIHALYENQEEESSKQLLGNKLHLKLAQNFLRYQWILTYLFGASPNAEDGFYHTEREKHKKPSGYMRSLRNSGYGYHNSTEIRVSYDRIEHYVNDIEELVSNGKLSEEREFYGTSRLRAKGEKVRNLLDSGVKYVEFRSFDLNPFDERGISLKQARFIHLFLMTMIWLDSTATEEEIDKGIRRNEATAIENPQSPSQFEEEGLAILKEMQKIAKWLNPNESYAEVVDHAIEAFKDPQKTLSAKIVNRFEQGSSFLDLGKEWGLKYKNESMKKPFLLRGFETMEMSTQLLVFDAIQRGIEVDVLDESDQFLKLTHKGHVEYVKNGNMTSKDAYISHWIMENKTVTKKILKDHGFIVPAGEEYQSLDEAIAHFYMYQNKPIVVKPKSTNYGLGISIFKKAPKLDDFKEALEIAFKEDEAVLVEEYIKGTEYRFFILNGEVQAVLLRTPANVIGDGAHTVSELIDKKNQDPYRGTNHRAPLEKIQKSSIEKLMLKEQELTFESVPEKDQIVYLRENSNISTGGDSIDFTDKMHESYKNIASKMAEPIGVKVTGIDLIIPNYSKPSTDDDPGYTVIEANFNPAMHMHAYVYEGKGQRLTQGILDMLFPEQE